MDKGDSIMFEVKASMARHSKTQDMGSQILVANILLVANVATWVLEALGVHHGLPGCH